MREGSTKLWELERAEARGGSKLNNIFSSFRKAFRSLSSLVVLVACQVIFV